MKYGLYYSKNSPTIGDDMWAYAASLYLPHIDYLIDNETIYKFESKDNEEVATIIAAFVEPRNSEWSFLPPPNVIPFFVGSYFRTTMWDFLDNEIIQKFLRAYSPIGVRSIDNVNKLKERDIGADFTGCITLTLPKFPKKIKNYICCVDVSENVINAIKSKIGNHYEIKKMTHEMWGNLDYYKSHKNMSVEERFKVVEEYIQAYADAHCVVTSRLHCALPCLAQDTPVLFVIPESNALVDIKERIEPFYNLMNVEKEENIFETSYDFTNPPKNSNNYLKLAKEVRERTERFIQECENGKVHSKNPYTEDERLKELVDILEKKVKEQRRQK